jgi:phosphatidate cytidylyltransferase
MSKRIIWGSLGAALLLGLIWAGSIWFTLAIGLLSILGILEYSQLLKKQNIRPQTAAMITLSLLLQALIYISAHYFSLKQTNFIIDGERIMCFFLFLAFLIVFVNELLRGNPEQGLLNAAANFFGTVYIGFMFAYILMVRLMPGGDGLFYILFTLLVTWSNDTGAYFVGSTLGKHKLSPRISPRKSIEGSIGGLIGGLTCTWVLAFLFHKRGLPLIILGVFVVAAGQIGDLIESIIKRNAGVKDSGTFLPGHGGLLDRFDSLLLAAPIVYYSVTYIAPHL